MYGNNRGMGMGMGMGGPPQPQRQGGGGNRRNNRNFNNRNSRFDQQGFPGGFQNNNQNRNFNNQGPPKNVKVVSELFYITMVLITKWRPERPFSKRRSTFSILVRVSNNVRNSQPSSQVLWYHTPCANYIRFILIFNTMCRDNYLQATAQ